MIEIESFIGDERTPCSLNYYGIVFSILGKISDPKWAVVMYLSLSSVLLLEIMLDRKIPL